MPKYTPITTPTQEFAFLCREMSAILSWGKPDLEAWASLEQNAFNLLQGGMFVDRHVLDPALRQSGSGRIMRLARERADEDSWQRYIDERPLNLPAGPLRNLAREDVIWLAQIGHAQEILLTFCDIVISEDDPDLLATVVEACAVPVEKVIERGLLKVDDLTPRLTRINDVVVASLRTMARDADKRATLGWLLASALMRSDLRFISTLLSLGAKIEIEGGAESCTPDQRLISLIKEMDSHHGRMRLVAMEPNSSAVLARDDAGPFHGLTPDPTPSTEEE